MGTRSGFLAGSNVTKSKRDATEAGAGAVADRVRG
jgi:hypothetical protein